VGIGLAGAEIIVYFIMLFLDSEFALKILTMIGACHVGGRLAFIGTGLEFEFKVLPLILIIITYNTIYLLLVYSIFIFLSEKMLKFRFIANLHQKVKNSKKIRSNWNLLSIAIFIWLPLPMTGATVGSLIAYFEGYDDHLILSVAIPTMWFAVISWTLAFDQMYLVLRNLSSGITLILTILLIISPIMFNFIRRDRK
jgi:uncharacterized membrane protein